MRPHVILCVRAYACMMRMITSSLVAANVADAQRRRKSLNVIEYIRVVVICISSLLNIASYTTM